MIKEIKLIWCYDMTYLHLFSLSRQITVIIGREKTLRRALNDVVLPTEGQPVSGELGGLEEREESESRASVVGDVDGDLLRRVVEGHRRERGVDRPHRRLFVGIGGANEHVHRRKMITITIMIAGSLRRPLEELGRLGAAEGAHPEGLRGGPHEGEDEVGGEEGERDDERG